MRKNLRMNNQCQPYQGRAVPLNRHFKCPAPTRALGLRALWQCGAKQSMKRAPRHVPPYQGNSDASLLFPKAVPETNPVASAFCGWQHREQRGSQMTAQHGSKSESAKRHHTAKRIVFLFLLRSGTRLSSNGLGAQRSPGF